MSRYYRSPHGPVPDLPGEEWRDWEELWEVSNLGRFKAKERLVENRRGIWRQRERLLTLHTSGSKGRKVLSARYQRDGQLKSASIYRAMWASFRGELPDDVHLYCEGEIRVDNLVLKRGRPNPSENWRRRSRDANGSLP